MSDQGGPGPRPRHDWRFLLPRSTFGGDVVVDGDTDGTAVALLRASGLYGAVHRAADAPRRPHDVVARLHDATGPVDGLSPYVGPDTVVVVEHRRSWKPSGLRRARRRWGHRHRDRYLVAPRHGATRWYAPLWSGAPLRWYLRDRLRADSPATALAVRVARGLCRIGLVRVLGLARPDQLVVSRQAAPPPSSGLSGVPTSVAASATMVLSSAQDAASRAVLVPFPARATEPEVVVKIAPRPEGNGRAAAESDRLTAIAAAGGPGVPAVVVDDHLGRLFRTTQTLAPGPVGDVVISAGLARDELPTALLDDVSDWCAALTTTGTGTWTLDADGLRRLVVGPVVPVLRSLGAEALASRFDHLAPDHRQIATVAAHFDLAPCNVVRTARGPVAVDWEPPLAALDDAFVAPVGADFVFFATYWAFQVAGCVSVDDEVEVATALLDAVFAGPGAGPASVAADAVRRHAEVVGLDPEALPHVALLLWTQRLLARHRRVAVAGGPPSVLSPEEQLAVRVLGRCLDALETPEVS